MVDFDEEGYEMMTYEAYYPLLIAKFSLKDCVYSKDPQKSEEISAEVQEAMGLVLDILRDFRDRENDAYDVGWQAAANQLRGLSWDNAALLGKSSPLIPWLSMISKPWVLASGSGLRPCGQTTIFSLVKAPM